MDNLTNKEPGIEDSTVQDSANKEQKKKESRPVIGAKAQTILEFLRACSPYEADSIRVMVGYGTGQGDIDTIEATDMLAVNRFLNHGLTRESGTSSEADENLVRLQGGGGSTAAPAIPTLHERREELKPNRNGTSDATAGDKENSIHGILPKPLPTIPPFRSLIYAK